MTSLIIAFFSKYYLDDQLRDVGLEVLTAVVMKGSIFWDITPCSP
jgi:hypothetical protein